MEVPRPLQDGPNKPVMMSLLWGHQNQALDLSVSSTSSDCSFCTFSQSTLCLGHLCVIAKFLNIQFGSYIIVGIVVITYNVVGII